MSAPTSTLLGLLLYVHYIIYGEAQSATSVYKIPVKGTVTHAMVITPRPTGSWMYSGQQRPYPTPIPQVTPGWSQYGSVPMTTNYQYGTPTYKKYWVPGAPTYQVRRYQFETKSPPKYYTKSYSTSSNSESSSNTIATPCTRTFTNVTPVASQQASSSNQQSRYSTTEISDSNPVYKDVIEKRIYTPGSQEEKSPINLGSPMPNSNDRTAAVSLPNLASLNNINPSLNPILLKKNHVCPLKAVMPGGALGPDAKIAIKPPNQEGSSTSTATITPDVDLSVGSRSTLVPRSSVSISAPNQDVSRSGSVFEANLDVKLPNCCNTSSVKATIPNLANFNAVVSNVDKAVKVLTPTTNILDSVVPDINLSMKLPNIKPLSAIIPNLRASVKIPVLDRGITTSLSMSPNSEKKSNIPSVPNDTSSLKLGKPPDYKTQGQTSETIQPKTSQVVKNPTTETTPNKISTPTSTSCETCTKTTPVRTIQVKDKNTCVSCRNPTVIPENYILPKLPNTNKAPLHACLAGYDCEIFKIIDDIKETEGNEIEVHFYLFSKCKFHFLSTHMTNIKTLQERLAKYHHYICLNKKYVEAYKEKEQCWYIEKLIMIPSFTGNTDLNHNFQPEEFNRLCTLRNNDKSVTKFEPLVLELQEKIQKKDARNLNNIIDRENKQEAILDDILGAKDMDTAEYSKVPEPTKKQDKYDIKYTNLSQDKSNTGVKYLNNRGSNLVNSISYNDRSQNKDNDMPIKYTDERPCHNVNVPNQETVVPLQYLANIPLQYRYFVPLNYNFRTNAQYQSYTNDNSNLGQGTNIPLSYSNIPDDIEDIDGAYMLPETNENTLNKYKSSYQPIYQGFQNFINRYKTAPKVTPFLYDAIYSNMNTVGLGKDTESLNDNNIQSYTPKYVSVETYTDLPDGTVSYTDDKGTYKTPGQNIQYDQVSYTNPGPKYNTITAYSSPNIALQYNKLLYHSQPQKSKVSYDTIESYSKPKSVQSQYDTVTCNGPQNIKLYDNIEFTRPQIRVKPNYNIIDTYTQPQKSVNHNYDTIDSYTNSQTNNKIKSDNPDENFDIMTSNTPHQKVTEQQYYVKTQQNPIYETINAYSPIQKGKDMTLSYLPLQNQMKEFYNEISSYTPYAPTHNAIPLHLLPTQLRSVPQKDSDYEIISSYSTPQNTDLYDVISSNIPMKYDMLNTQQQAQNGLYDSVWSDKAIPISTEKYDEIKSYSPIEGRIKTSPQSKIFENVSAYSPQLRMQYDTAQYYDPQSIKLSYGKEKPMENYDTVESYTSPTAKEDYDVINSYQSEGVPYDVAFYRKLKPSPKIIPFGLHSYTTQKPLELQYNSINYTNPQKSVRLHFDNIDSYTDPQKSVESQYHTIDTNINPDKRVQLNFDKVDSYSDPQKSLKPNYNTIDTYTYPEKNVNLQYDNIGSYTDRQKSNKPNYHTIDNYTTPQKRVQLNSDKIDSYTDPQKQRNGGVNYYTIGTYTTPRRNIQLNYDSINSYTDAQKSFKPNYEKVESYTNPQKSYKPNYHTIDNYSKPQKSIKLNYDKVDSYTDPQKSGLTKYEKIDTHTDPQRSDQPNYHTIDSYTTPQISVQLDYDNIESYTKPEAKPEFDKINTYSPKQLNYDSLSRYTYPKRFNNIAPYNLRKAQHKTIYSSTPVTKLFDTLSYTARKPTESLDTIDGYTEPKVDLKYEEALESLPPMPKKHIDKSYNEIEAYGNSKYNPNQYLTPEAKSLESFERISSYTQPQSKKVDYDKISAYTTPKKVQTDVFQNKSDKKYQIQYEDTQDKPNYERIKAYTDAQKAIHDSIPNYTNKKQFETTQGYTPSQVKLRYDTIKEYTDAQKQAFDSISKYTTPKDKEQFETIDGYTPAQIKLKYDSIKGYTDAQKPAFDSISQYTTPKAKERFNNIERYTPAQIKLYYDTIKAYTDAQKHTTPKSKEEFDNIEQYTPAQLKLKYDAIKAYTNAQKQAYDSIPKYTSPKDKEQFDTIEGYTPAQMNLKYDTIKGYTDAQKPAYDSISQYTTPKAKEEFDNIEQYTPAQLKLKYDAIKAYTDAQKPPYDSISEYIKPKIKEQFYNIEQYTPAQIKLYYDTIKAYTNAQKQAYDSISQYTTPKAKEEFDNIDQYSPAQLKVKYDAIKAYTDAQKPTYDSISEYTKPKTKEQFDNIEQYTPAQIKLYYDTIKAYTDAQKHTTPKAKEEFDNIDQYSPAQLKLKYDAIKAYTDTQKQAYDSISEYTKPKTKEQFDNVDKYTPAQIKLQYDTIKAYTDAQNQAYDSIPIYTSLKAKEQIDNIEQYTPAQIKLYYDTIKAYTDAQKHTSPKAKEEFDNIEKYTPAQLKLKYDAIKSYTDAQKPTHDSIAEYTKPRAEEKFDKVEKYTPAQIKLHYDTIKAYTDAQKQAYDSISKYTSPNAKEQYDIIRSYTPAQIQLKYGSVKAYNDALKEAYDKIPRYTTPKPKEQFDTIHGYTPAQSKEKYDSINAYTDAQKQLFDSISQYTTPKSKEQFDTIQGYTPAQIDLKYNKDYTDAQQHDSISHYTTPKPKEQFDTIDEYSNAQSKEKYDAIKSYTDARKPQYDTISQYTTPVAKQEYDTVYTYPQQIKLQYDEIPSYTQTQVKPEYEKIGSYTPKTQYDTIGAYTVPKTEHESIKDYTPTQNLPGSISYTPLQKSEHNDKIQLYTQPTNAIQLRKQKELPNVLQNDELNEMYNTIAKDQLEIDKKEKEKAENSNAIQKLIPDISNLAKYITAALNSIKQRSDLTQIGKEEVALGDIILEDKVKEGTKPYNIKSSDEGVAIKGIISKIKILRPRLVFDTKEIEVANFIPIVQDTEERDPSAIQDIATKAVEKAYKETIVLTDPHNSKDVMLKTVKSGNSERAFVWPAAYKSNTWYKKT